MKIRADIVDIILAVFIVLFLVLCVAIIRNTAKAHYDKINESIPVLRAMYPEIPQCDKELWLRIKDGCKDAE